MESFVFPENKGQERRLRTFKNVVLDPYSMRQKIPKANTTEILEFL